MVKRNTIQKQLTLDTVMLLKGHSTADDIYESIKTRYSDISKATVYRNLKELAEGGLIRKISCSSAADRFDHISKPHYHFRCPVCGRLADAEMEYMAELDEKIFQLTGSMPQGHEIFFNKLCHSCEN